MARVIHLDDMEIGYRAILHAILLDGEEVAPRGQPTLELNDVTLVHVRPSDCLLIGVGRKLSVRLAALEALQLIGGFSDPDLTVSVAPRYANFLDNGKFHGAYGIRTQDKIGLVANRLADDPDTRRALMTFWDDREDLAKTGYADYPCTVSMTFRIRNEKLTAHTHMRSNDAWLGIPYDIVQFTSLMRTLASFLGVGVGEYVHSVDSLHIYERDLPAVRTLLDSSMHPDERPRLTNGIVSRPGDEWSDVQRRAKQICYAPRAVKPRSPEEEWLCAMARRWPRSHA
jgi:thymidylate synthase